MLLLLPALDRYFQFLWVQTGSFEFLLVQTGNFQFALGADR